MRSPYYISWKGTKKKKKNSASSSASEERIFWNVKVRVEEGKLFVTVAGSLCDLQGSRINLNSHGLVGAVVKLYFGQIGNRV